MNIETFIGLLNKKLALASELYIIASEQNNLIIMKKFDDVLSVDRKKENLIIELKETDKQLEAFDKAKIENSENVKEIIEKINMALGVLIKLEKDNESMIEEAEKIHTGKYITAYKTYKQP